MKDFSEFEKFAKEHELECQRAAEHAMNSRGSVIDGNIVDPEDLINVAYVTSRAATIELLRQYHKWQA